MKYLFFLLSLLPLCSQAQNIFGINAQGALTFINASPPGSSGGAGTSSASPIFPTGLMAGDLLITIASGKPSTVNPTMIAAWTNSGVKATGGLGVDGTTDEGSTYSTYFYKVATGTESIGNTQTVTATGGTVTQARIFVYRKASGTYSLVASTGSDDIADLSWSVTGSSTLDITTGDILLATNAFNTDNHSFLNGRALTIPGVTVGTGIERQSSSTVTGPDMESLVVEYAAALGTATGASTFAATSSGTATNRPTGSGLLIRIR